VSAFTPPSGDLGPKVDDDQLYVNSTLLRADGLPPDLRGASACPTQIYLSSATVPVIILPTGRKRRQRSEVAEIGHFAKFV
jgi:hypothetical protein